MDLRTKKIYRALILSFQELLKEKTFEEITVNELCNKAQTRRATFYNHFSDKYDFFQYMLKTMRDDLLEKAKRETKVENSKEFIHMLVDVGLQFIDDNKKFLISIENSSMATAMVETTAEQLYNSEELDFIGDELTMQFLIGALNQSIKWWIKNKNKMSKEEMENRLYDLVDKYITIDMKVD